jgi:hypothetical protein
MHLGNNDIPQTDMQGLGSVPYSAEMQQIQPLVTYCFKSVGSLEFITLKKLFLIIVSVLI